MKLAFSTLGCPHWSLVQGVEAARRLGYEGVELRCLAGDMDLLRRPEFQPGEIHRTARLFADGGVAVCCIDTSCCFHDADEATRRDSVEVAERLPRGVAAGLETHGDFATAEEALDIVRLVDHPAAGIVWDAANTTAAGESI